MKKRYDSPITEVVIMDVTQNFLEISARVEDGTDDDSPF